MNIESKELPKQVEKSSFRIDVINCARCDKTHLYQLFVPFTNPPIGFTHFAICPTCNEPILMQKLIE